MLHGKITALLDSTIASEEERPPAIAVEHLLLACNIALFYCDFVKVNQYIGAAKNRCSHSSLLTGILGKRTRFQNTDYAQLVVELTEQSAEE